jgi:hypothetical protein
MNAYGPKLQFFKKENCVNVEFTWKIEALSVMREHTNRHMPVQQHGKTLARHLVARIVLCSEDCIINITEDY